jgi:hypothetical protein
VIDPLLDYVVKAVSGVEWVEGMTTNGEREALVRK